MTSYLLPFLTMMMEPMRADEIAALLLGAWLELVGDVSQELLYLVVHLPHVLALVVRHQEVVVLELGNVMDLGFDFHGRPWLTLPG
jgi:hypothetical protein